MPSTAGRDSRAGSAVPRSPCSAKETRIAGPTGAHAARLRSARGRTKALVKAGAVDRARGAGVFARPIKGLARGGGGAPVRCEVVPDRIRPGRVEADAFAGIDRESRVVDGIDH